MRRILLGVAAVLSAVACETAPPPLDLTAQAVASLDSVLVQAVELHGIPGVVAVVTSTDSVLYRGTAGHMDHLGDEPMRADAIFRIASMTKPITSVAVMMLAEEGAISLDDPASKYLPDLEGREVLESVSVEGSAFSTRPASREVSIRDLLSHTAGFGYNFSNHRLLELAQAVELSDREKPLLHDPGTEWTYGSSTGFLGWIVEEVADMPLADFFESRLTGPLGMDDTSPELPEEKHERLVAIYRPVDGELTGQPRPETYEPAFRGDGGLLSTADDYARFVQLMLGFGERAGTRLLSRESVEEMARNQLHGFTVTEQAAALPAWTEPFPMGAGIDGFGLGFQIAARTGQGKRSVGSLSWAGIYNTHFWIDHENRVGVVLLMQMLPFYDAGVLKTMASFEEVLYTHLEAGRE